MIRTGLIKAFGKNLSRKSKIICPYNPKHLKLLFPIKPIFLSISSDDENDCENKEGARMILINGLSIEGNEMNEIIIMNGKKKVLSKKIFLRINNMIVLKCGKKKYNCGNIYVTSFDDELKNGIPKKKLYHMIGKKENMSSCGIYTVPKGFIFQMTRFNMTCQCKIFNSITVNVYMKIKDISNMEIVEIYVNKYNCNHNYDIEYATPVGELTDVSITAKKHGLFKANFGCYYQFTLTRMENVEID